MPAIGEDGQHYYGVCCVCGDQATKADKDKNLLCDGCWPHWLKEKRGENQDERTKAGPRRKH